MEPSIHMEIGNVHLAVSIEDPIRLEAHGNTYQSFLAKTPDQPDADPADVQIKIKTGNIPSTQNLEALFRSNQTWSIFCNDSDYYISFQPPVFQTPLWVARMDRDFSVVTLYCHEKLTTRKNGRPILSNPVAYPLDQILLMYILSRKQGVLIHASGIEINGKGYLFPGRSGAGKSTLSHMFAQKKVGELLSDDRIAVRKIDDVFHAFGTPWPGEAGIAANRHAPLSGICFIYHGPTNTIKKISPKEAVTKLFPVTSIPWYDRDVLPEILDTCEDLVSRVPSYELHFTKGSEIVDVFKKFASVS
jgi:hypothetical protein